MEQELIASRNFLLLGYNIYKVLSLKTEHRVEKGRIFLDEVYNEYIKLVENANLIKSKKVKDALAEIPKLYVIPSTPSSSDVESRKNTNEDIGIELKDIIIENA
jgi:hypothetical protein